MPHMLTTSSLLPTPDAPKVTAENIGNVQKGGNVPGAAGRLGADRLGGSSSRLTGSQDNLDAEQDVQGAQDEVAA